MSKFASLLDLLDFENSEIKKREYSGNNRPFKDQFVAIIDLKLPNLNPQCENCVSCDVITTQGKIDELGVGGYASNQEDTEIKDEKGNKIKIGLKRILHNPAVGVKLREPRTIIMGCGQVFCCRNRKNTGSFFLNGKDIPCGGSEFKEKIKVK
jgi:hypothetical protein